MPLQSFVDGNRDIPVTAAWLNAIDVFYFTLFNSATTAALARTALAISSTAEANALYASLAGPNTLTGPINDTLETVASHATTADIWSAGNEISWTGTETTTAFPAAPVAGACRTLHCTGACKFTTGANLLIIGIESGVTITMKANARVTVMALSTTQFQLEYALSGSFTATGTGFTTAETQTWYYSVVNGQVQISAHNEEVGATSNTTAFTITGFPAEITPSTNRLFRGLPILDNSAVLYTGSATLANTGVMTLYTTLAGVGWTASGGKTLYTTEWSYIL